MSGTTSKRRPAEQSVEVLMGMSSGIKDLRTAARTKNSYKGKLETIIKWMKSKYPNLEVDVNGEVVLPFPNEFVISFFAHLMSPANKRMSLNGPHELPEEGSVEPFSHSHVVGFRSALVDFYRSRRVVLPAQTDSDLKGLVVFWSPRTLHWALSVY